MRIAEFGSTCAIPEPYSSGLNLVRGALQDAGLSILGELDLFGGPDRHAVAPSRPCRVIYIDSPLLLFEALALDRAAAVFLPLHVVVREDGGQTRVHWISPAAVFGMRLPAGAAVPLYDLQTRVSDAIAPLGGVRT